VDEVNRVVPQLIRSGKVTRPTLGVQLAPDQLTRQVGLKGALVLGVQPGSPAAQAGLRPTRCDENNRILLGDLIVALDGKPVRSVSDLLDVLEERKAGDRVRVTVLRDGQEQQLAATLAETEEA
jgi:S1-C subfamily serine protease